MLKKISIGLLLVVGIASTRAAEPERSVIQIKTFTQEPDWDRPWRFGPVRQMGGSGFVIKGKRIMSNAHVVAWAKRIIVTKYQDPKQYLANIEFSGNDCDLAVLTVEDERFFDNLEPLEFGELPKARSTVVTYGYPAGGQEISYTRGVVSRVELQTYVHVGNRQYLGVQTDAAINPGNSGGPVIQDDRVVGVAFQGTPGLENTGFFIPPPVIEHFLKDIEDKRYDGFPQAGIRIVALQNPAYRSLLKAPDNNLGARVDSMLPIPSTEKVLKEDDVILRIGEYPVASDGTILYQGNRLFAGLAFQNAQHGDSVPLRLWRDGKEMGLSLPISVYDGDRTTGNQYGVLPRYFVYGGLVFTPLSLDYMRTLRAGVSDASASELNYELFYRRHENFASVRPEPIVLASVLPDAANANMTSRGRVLVDKINGVRIERLEDVVRAFENNANAQDLIELVPNKSFECLDRKEVAQANPRILATYGLPSDRRL